MFEVTLQGLGREIEEGTIQNWFFEEGDPVNAGDDLVEIATAEGLITIQAPAAGILAEVYYDEGEAVVKGELLCTIDEEEQPKENDEEEEEEDEDADEEEKEEDDSDEK